MQFLSDSPSLVGWISKAGLYWGLLNGAFSLGNNIGVSGDGNRHDFRASFLRRIETPNFTSFVSELTVNGQTVQRTAEPSSLPEHWLYGLFALHSLPDGYIAPIRMWSCKCWSATAKFDLIPALRKADGVAGMWDTVSKQFFTNAGSGTFGYRIKTTGQVVAPTAYSLRDPWRVAPSGVWARLAPDGTLDAVAETEIDEEQAEAQGYAYFANTADAAEALGATEQGLA